MFCRLLTRGCRPNITANARPILRGVTGGHSRLRGGVSGSRTVLCVAARYMASGDDSRSEANGERAASTDHTRRTESPLLKYHIEEETNTTRSSPRPFPRTPADIIAFKKKMLASFPQPFIRNVSIVAHVDHGKTTLTDALLRRAGLLPADGATGTFTDRLAVEKERGITIKAQTCSVFLTRRNKETGEEEEYLINLIDTPGHVDFQYEVSRSLSASEGAALLVDVSQGVEAQTMSQFYASLEQDLTIIPILTKLDQVLTDDVVDAVLQQLEDSTGLLRREVVLTSAKAKQGMEAVFNAIIDRISPPHGCDGFSDLKQYPVMHPDSPERKKAEASLVPLRALLFDCWTAQSSGMRSGGGATRQEAPPSSSAASKSGAGALPSSANLIDANGVAVNDDGVYCLVRVVDGTITPGTVITFFHSRDRHEVREVGILHPSLHPTAALTAGMVGYVFLPGLRKKDIQVGDTLCTVPTRRFTLAPRSPSSSASAPAKSTAATSAQSGSASAVRASNDEPAAEGATRSGTDAHAIVPIPGFKQVQPVVFGGFYPDEGEMITQLREAVEALCINDPSVTVEALQCQALGAGLQLGFLGLLHMQVFKERLLSEFGQNVLVTPPQVQYMCVEQGDDPDDLRQRHPLTVQSWRWPHEGIAVYLEPIVHATIVTPKEYFNPINQAALTLFRGEQTDMRVVDDARILVRYHMPLADLARGFFITVKSASHGYASLDYDDAVYTPADLVKVDIVINKAKISALSIICPRHEAHTQGKRIIASLKESLLRSSVDLPLQALVGNKIIARETIKAYRKDVTAKIHAGDISRKQKKWSDQKKGKERMARRSVGTVTLDQSVLAAAMGATTMK